MTSYTPEHPRKCDMEDATFNRMYKTRKRLDGWRKALDDPKKFQPVMRCEYGRAFDENVKAEDAAVKCNVKRYISENPDHAMAFSYLVPGLYEFVLWLNGSQFASDDTAYAAKIREFLA